jgi:predicted molibdopterin-dependent oxidoreductase YjgC
LCQRPFRIRLHQFPERLTTPLIKEGGASAKASWDEALDLVAKRFTEIKGPARRRRLWHADLGRVTNEENYIANKFTRAVLKTNNIDHCARL